MRFRTVALALALACGFTASMEAKHTNTTQSHSKPAKATKLKVKKYKPSKFKTSKFKTSKFKPAKAK